MLRRNELVSEVKQILYEYGPEAYLGDNDCAKDIVDRVLALIQKESDANIS